MELGINEWKRQLATITVVLDLCRFDFHPSTPPPLFALLAFDDLTLTVFLTVFFYTVTRA